MSYHFGLLRLGFLSFLPFRRCRVGRNHFFAGPPGGINPVPSSNDPWPKPIFWQARLATSTQVHPQTTLGRNGCFAGPLCGAGQYASSNDPWPKPIFLLARFMAPGNLILKRPWAETDFLLARFVASFQPQPFNVP